MPQFALAGRQPAANLVQRFGPAQLTEQHGNKLSPTAEPRRMPFRLVFRATASTPLREISYNICEKMLHTLIKAGSSSDSLSSQTQLIRDSASFFQIPLRTAELIWTSVEERHAYHSSRRDCRTGFDSS
jgi:hypothetical protein